MSAASRASISPSVRTRLGQRVDDPLRVGVRDARWPRSAPSRVRPADPVVEVVLGRPCAARRWRTRPGPGPTSERTRSTVVLIAACGGTRIASSWWAPSRSTSSTLACDLGQRPVDAGGEDRVVGALPPDRAGGQLGRERRVAARRARACRRRCGQHEVGVGVLGPDRLAAPRTRRAGRRAGSAVERGSPPGSARPGASWPATSAPRPATRR